MDSIISQRLRELRATRQLTQKQLAAAVSVSEIAVQNYESGRRKPALDNLVALADCFNVSLDYLVGRSNAVERADKLGRPVEASILERIVELRKRDSLTQKQLAAAVSVSEIAVQNYESGRRKPAFDVLIALADCFDVSLDYLVGRADE